jgi:uncharacterized protein YjbI with pentapeptide repeats
MATSKQPAGPHSKEELARLVKAGAQEWGGWKSIGQTLDLSGADLAGGRLNGLDLSDFDLRGADLHGAEAARLNLRNADLRGANLRAVKFEGVELFGADLRNANLQGADLSGVKAGLLPLQLAGTDLTGAVLSKPLETLYDNLGSVSEISDSAKKVFLGLLAGCLYCWLTIGTTKDVDLITNRASSPLPIIQTPLPIVGFYVIAPIILLCIYFYFHFYLQKLWEELASLPAIFVDGRPLYVRADPWLFNDLVRAHFSKLREGRPFLSYFQQWISILLAWWIVPITLVLFWARYLPRHDRFWTLVLAVILAWSIVSALQLYRLTKETLRGYQRTAFTWKGWLGRRKTYMDALRLLIIIGALVAISVDAISGTPVTPELTFGQQTGVVTQSYRTGTWAPTAMWWIGYSPFANLEDVDVSIKPPNWTGKKEEELDLVKGANLSGQDLRYARASDAFLANAQIRAANLRQAKLSNADMRQADLAAADLTDAALDHSDIEGAHFENTELHNASLYAARVKYADFRGAIDLRSNAVKDSFGWQMAFFDANLLEELGLPADHNQALAEYQKSGSQEPFDSWQLKWRQKKAETAPKTKAK